MKIELKSVQHYPRLSDETNAFNANLYIDGIKVAACENQGKGGPTSIWVTNKEKYKQYQDFIKSLPPRKSEYFPGEEFPVTEEDYIDDLLYAFLNEKELKKLTKKSIVYADTDTPDSYKLITYKNTIAQLMAHPEFREHLIKKVEELKKQGKHVFNTNIL